MHPAQGHVDRYGVCPYMRPNGRINVDSDRIRAFPDVAEETTPRILLHLTSNTRKLTAFNDEKAEAMTNIAFG